MRDQHAYRLLFILWITVACLSIVYQALVNHWNVITWDTYGYYLYLPAFLKYGDWINFAFVEQHHNIYEFSADIYQVHEVDKTGKMVPTYLYGLSILYFPFYLVGELLARITRFPTDGLSLPYQVSIAASGWVYGFFAFRLLYQVIRQYLRPLPILLSLFILLIGTNYGYYVLAQPASIHAELFFPYALLIWISWKYLSDPSYLKAIIIGLVSGILICSRPSEVVCLSIPIILYAARGNGFSNIPWKHLLAATVAVVLLALPQLLLWKSATGTFLYNPYPHTLDWLNPHILDGLFSYRKGWLVYTPLMLFALGGIFVPGFSRSDWFWPVLIFLPLNIYIVFSWPMWWYSSSFGMRAMIQSYAVLAIPLAFCMSFLIYNNIIIRWSAALILGMLVGLNNFQAWQYEQRILPLDHTTKTYYWKVFGATERDRMLYQYLDHEEIMPDSLARLCQPLDSVVCRSEKTTPDSVHCETGPDREDSPGFSGPLPEPDRADDYQWIRVKGSFRSMDDQYDYHHQARLVVAAIHPSEEKSYYWTEIRLQQLSGDTSWQPFSFDYRIPLRKAATYKTYVWNNGPDQVRLRNFQVYFCPAPNSLNE